MVTFKENDKNLVIPSALGNFPSNGGGEGGLTPEEAQEMIDASISGYDETVQVEFANTNSGVSANTQAIGELSASTEQIGTNLSDLSASTGDLSAVTAGLETDVNNLGLYLGNLSAATSGIAVDLETLSAYTATISGGSGEEIIQNYQIVDDLSAVTGETHTVVGAYSGVVIDYSTAPEWVTFVNDSEGRGLYASDSEGNVYDWDWNPVEDDGGEYRLREVDGRQLYQKLDKANKSLTLLAVNPADVTYTVQDCSYVDTALTYSEEVTTYPEGQLAYVKGKKVVNETTFDWTKYQSVFESGEEISGLTLVSLCWSGNGEDWTLFSITQTGDTLSSDKGGNLEELICNDAWDNHKIEFEIYDENWNMVSLYVRYRAYNNGGPEGNQGWDNVSFSNDIYYSETGEVYSGGSIYWVLGEDAKIEDTGTETISEITDFAFPTFYKWNGTNWQQAYIYLNGDDNEGLINDYLAFGGGDVNEIKSRFVFNGEWGGQTKEPLRIENGKLYFRKDTLLLNPDNTIQIDVEYDNSEEQPTGMTLTSSNYVITEDPDWVLNKNEGTIAYIPEKVETWTEEYGEMWKLSPKPQAEGGCVDCIRAQFTYWGSEEKLTASTIYQSGSTFLGTPWEDGNTGDEQYRLATILGKDFYWRSHIDTNDPYNCWIEFQYMWGQFPYQVEVEGTSNYEHTDDKYIISGETLHTEYFVQAHMPDPEDPWNVDWKKLDIAKKKYLEVDGGNGLYDELVRLYTSGITDFSGYKFVADFSSVDSGINNTAISLELTKFDTDNDVIVFTGALCDGDSTGSVRTFRVELTSSGTLQNMAVGYIYSGPKSEVLTQAEYDALVQAGTVDPDILYIII